MPKTSGLPNDDNPQSDDYAVSLEYRGGVYSLKRSKWQNYRKLFSTKRVNSNVTNSNPAPNADTDDVYTLSGLSANATIAAPGGTPTDGQSLFLRIKDDGTARTLTWNAIYRGVGVTIPTTTTAGKVMYVGCLYNSDESTWDVVSVGRL